MNGFQSVRFKFFYPTCAIDKLMMLDFEKSSLDHIHYENPSLDQLAA